MPLLHIKIIYVLPRGGAFAPPLPPTVLDITRFYKILLNITKVTKCTLFMYIL